jgi:hypothetical protein
MRTRFRMSDFPWPRPAVPQSVFAPSSCRGPSRYRAGACQLPVREFDLCAQRDGFGRRVIRRMGTVAGRTTRIRAVARLAVSIRIRRHHPGVRVSLAGLKRSREFFGIGLSVLFLVPPSVFLETLEIPSLATVWNPALRSFFWSRPHFSGLIPKSSCDGEIGLEYCPVEVAE